MKHWLRGVWRSIVLFHRNNRHPVTEMILRNDIRDAAFWYEQARWWRDQINGKDADDGVGRNHCLWQSRECARKGAERSLSARRELGIE